MGLARVRVAEVRYLCDSARHLVCYPYSVAALHDMARDLAIDRCWFHAGARHAHYDIPKRRLAEVSARCEVVDARTILRVTKGGVP